MRVSYVMDRIRKWIWKWKTAMMTIVLVCSVVVFGLVFHDRIVKFAFEKSLSGTLGVSVAITKLSADPFGGRATLEGIRLDNPAGFPTGILADISKLYLEFEPFSLSKGNIHWKTIDAAFENIRVLCNDEGQINWLCLKPFQSVPAAQSRSDFRLGNLSFSLGSATYTDLSGSVPVQKSYHLKGDNVAYRDIDSVTDMVLIITWEIFRRMGIDSKTSLFDEIKKRYNVPKF
ncbi:MAG: hypothetical protein NC930_05950 [Candidatus Omnitrophica bacterium]|nr:hypothetical protein [Candidatus Omnitrophota bacterium]